MLHHSRSYTEEFTNLRIAYVFHAIAQRGVERVVAITERCMG